MNLLIAKKTSLLLPLSLFLFVILIYPFIYNAALYVINYALLAAGVRPNTLLSYLLLGWKDIALLVCGGYLLWRANKFSFSIVLFVGATVLLLFQLAGIKQIFEPFFILWVCLNYQNQLLDLCKKKGTLIWQILLVSVFFLLIIGFADYAYRFSQYIDDNSAFFAKHLYLRASNFSRCLMTHNLSNYLNCIIDPMNSYKLLLTNQQYYALPALFLPVGDSVVFALLLFYFLAFYLMVDLTVKAPCNIYRLACCALLFIAIFFTLNRVASLFALFLLFIYVRQKRRDGASLAWLGGLSMMVLLTYICKIDYLLKSIFVANTPSNLGHMLFFKTMLTSHPALVATGPGILHPAIELIPQQQFLLPSKNNLIKFNFLTDFSWLKISISMLFPWLMLGLALREAKRLGFIYLAVITSLIVVGLRVGVPIVNFQQIDITETNFIKAVAQFGLVGASIYAFILASIIQRVWQLFTAINLTKDAAARSCMMILICMATQFLLYQLIAPYVISGFVVFCAFISLWFFLTKYYTSSYGFA